MKRFSESEFSEFRTKVKVIGAELGNTVTFLVVLYLVLSIAVRYEIIHSLR